MPATDPKIIDAVRTVGHLLEHNGNPREPNGWFTAYAYRKDGSACGWASNNAHTFCAYGATYRVAMALQVSEYSLQSAVRQATGELEIARAWDGGTKSERRDFYTKLQNFNG